VSSRPDATPFPNASATELFSGLCDQHSAALVRHRLQEVLSTLELPSGKAADMELAVTELVSNAYQAGARLIDAYLAVEASELQVQVTDDAPGVPQMQPYEPDATHGRGLRIVESVSDAWGTTFEATTKSVWAVFQLGDSSWGGDAD
jgi:anti-sigma regulatory factor (Ser/Thr protein kinase)